MRIHSDIWTSCLEFLPFEEVQACKAVSTDLGRAARTALEVGRFRPVVKALELLPSLSDFCPSELEKTCLCAAWCIDSGALAKAAVSASKEWVLLVVEPTPDGLARVVAALEGVGNEHGDPFHEWMQTLVDRASYSDDELSRLYELNSHQPFESQEYRDTQDAMHEIEQRLRRQAAELKPALRRGFYRELQHWGDAKRTARFVYETSAYVTAEDAMEITSEWKDVKKRSAFVRFVSKEEEKRWAKVPIVVKSTSVYPRTGEETHPAARHATRPRPSTFVPSAGTSF